MAKLVSGKIRNVGTLVSGRVKSVGGMVFPVDTGPTYPLAAFGDYYWPATALTVALGDPVPDWTDVNAGKAIAQTDPTRRPVLIETLGSRAVKPDGSNDYLWTSDADVLLNGPTASQDYAIFAVLSGDPNASGQIVCLGDSASGLTNPMAIRVITGPTTTAVRQSTASAGAVISGGVGSYVVGQKNAVLITVSGEIVKLWRNGSLLGSVGGAGGNWLTNTLAIGGLLRNSFVVPSPLSVHCVLVAKGSLALPYHTDPSALFAAATAEWGTP